LVREAGSHKAVEVSQFLRARCHSLAEYPERAACHRGDFRRLVAGAYPIFYRIADPDDPKLHRVIVSRVLHGAQDIDRLVDPDGV
jgi:plasmid stabilization system protein ParE